MNTVPQEVLMYCAGMEQVKLRLAGIDSILKGHSTVVGIDTQSELLAIQFRKTLEHIAFGSLLANRAKYSAAYADYAKHWRAKDLLRNLSSINPGFYPTPLKAHVVQADGTKHFPEVKSGFLTQDQFTDLYTDCNSMLHTRNPFTLKKPKVVSPQSATKWIKLIKGLLKIHLAKLVDQSDGWLIHMNFDSNHPVEAALFGIKPGSP